MRRCLPPLVVLCLLAAGCGIESASPTGSADTSAAATGSPLEVVAAIYPLAWLGSQIAPDAAVELLNSGGQEAHDIDLSPPQRAAVETADVVLYTGDIDYQPQVEDAVAAAEGEVISAAEVAGDALLAAATDAHDDHEGEEEGEEHAKNEGKEHAEEGVGVDPHLWLDPAIMNDLAAATGDAFAAADPDNADTYRSNAEKVQADLATLAADLDATLGGDCRFEEAIVSHAAYGYLLAPYDKEQHAVTSVTAESDASAGELAEIVAEIRMEGFTHVLAEPVEGREGAETVVREAGVGMLEISPLDAVSDEQAEQGLPDLVRAQADAFATALGCA